MGPNRGVLGVACSTRGRGGQGEKNTGYVRKSQSGGHSRRATDTAQADSEVGPHNCYTEPVENRGKPGDKDGGVKPPLRSRSKEGQMGNEAWIVSAVRTPVGRAYKGSLRATRPDDLAALVIKEAIARVPGLDEKEIDDVILGCAMPEGEQGMNVARIAALRAGLPVETSAMTINR